MLSVTIIHHFGGLGGAGKSLVNNVKLLSKSYKVTVILPSSPTDISNLLSTIKNVNLVYLDFMPTLPKYSGGFSTWDPRLYLHIYKSFKYKDQLINLINEINSDFLVVNSLVLCWLSGQINNNNKICFVRETKVKSVFVSWQKKHLELFDKVVFISQYDKLSWDLNTYSVVIPNFIDDKIIEKKYINKRSNDIKKLLFLGGTSYIKGFYFLLFSLFFCKKIAEVEVTVLGELNKKVLKVLNVVLGNRFNLKFIGKVNNVEDYYLNSDVVLFPVVKVHQGRPIFEAGMYGKPVIVPDFDNISEYVVNNYNGLVYKKKSLKSIANIIDGVVNNNFDLVKMGNNNNKMTLKNHVKGSAENKIKNLFNTLELDCIDEK